MALDAAAEQRVREEAERRGIDPAAALAHARALPPADSAAPVDDANATPTRPLADRLLIGFLPFIKVHELRSMWLGLDDRIPDDELTCGDYQIKHGGAAAAPAPGGE